MSDRPKFYGAYKILTTKPIARRFSLAHPELLYVLPMEDITGARLYYVVMQTDGTEISNYHTLGDLRYSEVQMIDISESVFDYSGKVTGGNGIASIRFYVDTTANSQTGDYITAYPYHPEGDTVYPLYYANSQGG